MTITLTTFIPGTKAKADEVNANFSALKEAVEAKASINGDNTQTFVVADGTQSSHAVNKGQLDDLSADLTGEINKTGTKFCVKSGNVSNGAGNLFSYNVLEITPLVGGTYENLVISDYRGIQTTISSVSNISLTGVSNGTYNIFINSEGELYILNNTIHIQAARPTMVVNDVWLNTGVEPLKCIKYNGTSDISFLDVPLGKVIVSSGTITSIKTFPFNQNEYNVTTQTEIKAGTNLAASVCNAVMPDYANGVTKTWATTYQAETDGFVYVWATFGSTLQVSVDNSTWKTVQYSWHSDQGYSASSFIPISKGLYYKANYTSSSGSTSLVFYPCLGY